MNHLLRDLAPITESGWRLLDEEAKTRLTPALAARRFVDFSGPHGWEHSATNLGRTSALTTPPCDGVSGLQRRVLPLIEMRADFQLAITELRDADRGADTVDLGPLDQAAHQIAVAENLAVFDRWQDAISGIGEVSPHAPIALGTDAEEYTRAVAEASRRLLQSGISGPYGLALGSEQYQLVSETAEHGGYPLHDHLKKILDGPIVWAPGLSGAIVASLRGGDFVFDAGQDISVGYLSHDADKVQLYLEESFSFHVATPEAAVKLPS